MSRPLVRAAAALGVAALLSVAAALPARADVPVQTPPQPTAGGDFACDMFANGYYAPCVQTQPTTGDESWQRGYKLTWVWTTPLDQNGDPYQRCVLQYFNPPTPDDQEELSPLQVDVDASWGTFTIPLRGYGWLLAGIKAGATRLDEQYFCYTDGVGSSDIISSGSALIPDLPPTDPTTAATTASDDDVSVATGGSVVLGVAPLEGYDISVVSSSGAVVADAQAAPLPAPAPGAARVPTAGATVKNPARHLFRNLPEGTYTVKVRSFNTIGASAALSTKTIRITHLPPGPAKKLTVAKQGSHGVTVRWTAAASTAGVAHYRLTLIRGSHQVATVTVGAKTRSHTFSKLSHGTYRVTITTIDVRGLTHATSHSFTLG